MYVPRHFSRDHVPTLHGFMAQYGFATLVTSQDGTPFASHLPLLVESTAGASPRACAARAMAWPKRWRV